MRVNLMIDGAEGAGKDGEAPFLSLRCLSKTFRRQGRVRRALQGVNLDFAPGGFTVILGPSGCGKSTLLSIIAGIIPPDEGQVLLAGRDITYLPMEKRRFGMVFQHYALFPHLSVAENIAYGLRAARWEKSARRARVAELLDMVRLEDYSRSLPAELSGGQQQRVALARAIALRPSLLLLDEPLSALDARVRGQLGGELLRIQRHTGLTAVMVTHDQEEAFSLADRIILLNEGRVEQEGSPQNVYDQPAGAFAAAFIGRMNFLRLPFHNPAIAPEAPPQRQTPYASFGIRYEDVLVRRPTEMTLREPYTLVGKVLRSAPLGACARLEILLNDFATQIFADVPRAAATDDLRAGRLVAVSFPPESWKKW
jgi:ABC-type Fe3+/spermidine/putrescine transport system ATPase subunit